MLFSGPPGRVPGALVLGVLRHVRRRHARHAHPPGAGHRRRVPPRPDGAAAAPGGAAQVQVRRVHGARRDGRGGQRPGHPRGRFGGELRHPLARQGVRAPRGAHGARGPRRQGGGVRDAVRRRALPAPRAPAGSAASQGGHRRGPGAGLPRPRLGGVARGRERHEGGRRPPQAGRLGLGRVRRRAGGRLRGDEDRQGLRRRQAQVLGAQEKIEGEKGEAAVR
mmetsp:Transcript_16661/g.49764  ORF Transcript_16661/g.49764 Transcript_16661/m.49764 type:complete len:222 (+) Transcript_16661:478-1143(+)